MWVSKWQDLRCNLLKNPILWWKKFRVWCCKGVGHLQPLTSAFVPYTTSPLERLQTFFSYRPNSLHIRKDKIKEKSVLHFGNIFHFITWSQNAISNLVFLVLEKQIINSFSQCLPSCAMAFWPYCSLTFQNYSPPAYTQWADSDCTCRATPSYSLRICSVTSSHTDFLSFLSRAFLNAQWSESLHKTLRDLSPNWACLCSPSCSCPTPRLCLDESTLQEDISCQDIHKIMRWFQHSHKSMKN